MDRKYFSFVMEIKENISQMFFANELRIFCFRAVV